MGHDSINDAQRGGGGGQTEHVFEEREAGAHPGNVSRNRGGSVRGWAEGEGPSLQGLGSVGHGAAAQTCSVFACRQETDLAMSVRKHCPISQDGWSAAAPATACPSALWVAALVT